MAKLSVAVPKKDEKGVIEAVKAAVAIYGAARPAEPEVDTVNGTLPLSVVFALDEDAKWAAITSAYADILQSVKRIPSDLDKKIETAKLIATNPTLRNLEVAASGDSDEDIL